MQSIRVISQQRPTDRHTLPKGNAWPNPFEFNCNGNNYLQTHGAAKGTKTAVSFANIYMAETETNG